MVGCNYLANLACLCNVTHVKKKFTGASDAFSCVGNLALAHHTIIPLTNPKMPVALLKVKSINCCHHDHTLADTSWSILSFHALALATSLMAGINKLSNAQRSSYIKMRGYKDTPYDITLGRGLGPVLHASDTFIFCKVSSEERPARCAGRMAHPECRWDLWQGW